MVSYSLKRNCSVYLVSSVNGSLQKYKLDVYPDLEFSQTFDQQSRNVKTLHDQNAMFEDASINKANPANFSFTILLNNSTDHITVGNLLTYNNPARDGSVEALWSSDLYIDTGVDVFKLTKCVFERGTYQITRNSIITVSVNGTASRLSRYGATGTAIPGTLSSFAATVIGIIPRATAVELDGVSLPNIAGITLELTNSVEWLGYDTLHKSLAVTGPSDSQYPEAFVVTNKNLSGTIQQYLTDVNEGRLNTWSTNSSLNLRVGNVGNYFFNVTMPSVIFTNRLQMADAIMQAYDFKMNANPSSLATVIDYIF